MSRVLGKAPAPASPAEQAAAKEQRRRGRFRAAKRLARFNAWLFGPKLVDGKWVKGDRIGTCGRKLVGRGDDAPKYPGLKRLATNVQVIARAPAQLAPSTLPIAAISSSACTMANVALPDFSSRR